MNNDHLSPTTAPCFLPRLKHLPFSNTLLPLFFFAALLFCSAAVTPAQAIGSANLPPAAMSVPNDPERLLTLERRVFELVNAERVKNGVAPLKWADQVAAVARRHSASMVEFRFFGHEDLEGREPEDRADQFGVGSWRVIAENIAWISGQQDPAARAVLCWMASAGHRRNILNPAFGESGIGIAVTADGRVYLTQNFIARK